MITRRRFTQAVAASLAVPGLTAGVAAGEHSSLGPVRHVDAGDVRMAYVEYGTARGPVVLLLHGWPYDPCSYIDVGPLLAARGYRVIVPYLRGFGPTVFRSPDTVRNAQQSAVALDVIALMDALRIDRAVIGGYDWGARTADVIAALWPSRCAALVSVSGYLITNLAANLNPLKPAAEYGWWYQFYFATERGAAGYRENTAEFNRLIWRIASPTWDFDDATYARTAASFTNPDHVAIVLHNYRWRLGLAPGEPRFDEYERLLAATPKIAVPTIKIGSDFDGPNIDGSSYRSMFTGRYEHRVFSGIGHNVPQEAPRDFAKAVVDASRL
ncbi:alpha/beta fold hydrolase [Saccharothrix variisporea]|uniref:Pimeloyl-ACP methyl ester carboxylesterase n=1 Tax=Saccharothrix variisporea TaxID=543527 RepID=A0A495X2N5_9PSEU|nr:alpha/beta hydrolase [Saccharothrix variisporea]RKT67799.1 pimeloyl-ACP methyl ester carboxylesterase [Saccharothrix variisporea]